MQAIDETFLSVHPRTKLWWQQRKQCEKCAWSKEIISQSKGAMMRCAAVKGGGHANRFDGSCLAARDEGAKCGPNARLFRAIK